MRQQSKGIAGRTLLKAAVAPHGGAHGRALRSAIGPNQVHGNNYDQWNVVDGMRFRKKASVTAESGPRCSMIGPLGMIATTWARTLSWMPETEQFTEDPKANRRLSTPVQASGIVA